MAAIWLQGLQTSMVTVAFSGAQGMTPRAEVVRSAATTRMVATNVNAVTRDIWKVVGFRTLSPEAHAALVACASDQGLSVSGYLRRVVADTLSVRQITGTSRTHDLTPKRYAYRKVRGEEVGDPSMTVGEVVTAAIDHRARAWHSSGLYFDKNLPELQTKIRESMPALRKLERSTESVDAAMTRIRKSSDSGTRQAVGFLDSWG